MAARNIGLPSFLAALLLAGGRGVQSQELPPSQVAEAARRETSTASARSARELVAELEGAAEGQRTLLQKTEAALARARALQAELEGHPGEGPDPATGRAVQGRRLPGLLPEQAAAEETPWRWSDEKAEARFSIKALRDGYAARVENTQKAPWLWKLVLTRGGEDVYAWDGHEHSVFVVAGDVLYLADFHHHRSGCAVLARDLRAGKDLWRTDLFTNSAAQASQYLNRINLEVDGRLVTVFGNEGAGRYLELLDRDSGKIVGYRLIDVADGLLPRDE